MFPMKWTAGLVLACAAFGTHGAQPQQRQQAQQQPQQFASDDDMFAALRFVRDNIPGSHAWDWAFDGDTLYTDLHKTWTDDAGRLYQGGYAICLDN